jgi:tRNA-modifying protein YgfZ
MRSDYGDVTAEYLALREGTGYLEGFSDVVWAAGADAESFLDGQVSQDIGAMAMNATARSLILEPRGKLVAIPWIIKSPDRIGLVVAAGNAEALIEHLKGFLFRVEVSLIAETRPIAEVWGRDLAPLASSLGLTLTDGWDPAAGVGLLRGRVLQRLIMPGGVDPVLGLRPCGRIASDAVRVEAGEPLMGSDVDGSTIPQESGLVDESVSFTKGCFVGQELVARIDSRGRVNRRLVGVVVGENLVPPVGAEVLAGGTAVGSVSTVGESLALMAPVALAMVRREVEPGDPVTLRWDGGEVSARVETLPLDDLAESSHSSYTSRRD